MLTDWTQRDIAMLALMVACASATFVLGGLVWQIFLYRLSGARLKVTLAHGLLNPRIGLFEVSPPMTMRDEEKAGPLYFEQQIEVLICRVVNTGRTAISVERIGLDFGRVPWKWSDSSTWVLRSSHTVEPVSLRVFGGKASKPRRLDTGESVSLIFPLWNSLRNEQRERATNIGGYAKPAGRRMVKSPRRHRFHIQRGQETLVQGHTVTREERAYRALWSATSHDKSGDIGSVAWGPIRDALPDATSDADVRALLNKWSSGGSVGRASAAYAIWEAYNWRPGDKRISHGF